MGQGVQTANRPSFFFAHVTPRLSHPDFSYPEPYNRLQKHSDRTASPSPEPNPPPANPQTSKQIDSSTFSQLLLQLMPIAVNEPLVFESKAAAVCASFNLDSATSADIISSLKQQFPTIRNRETTYVASQLSMFDTDVNSQRSARFRWTHRPGADHQLLHVPCLGSRRSFIDNVFPCSNRC